MNRAKWKTLLYILKQHDTSKSLMIAKGGVMWTVPNRGTTTPWPPGTVTTTNVITMNPDNTTIPAAALDRLMDRRMRWRL
jgi:hypothetical protein